MIPGVGTGSALNMNVSSKYGYFYNNTGKGNDMPHLLTSSVLLVSLTLGGCVFAPGDRGDDRDDRDNARPTIGQELLDLDRAREAGVISTTEYERTKARILEQN